VYITSCLPQSRMYPPQQERLVPSAFDSTIVLLKKSFSKTFTVPNTIPSRRVPTLSQSYAFTQKYHNPLLHRTRDCRSEPPVHETESKHNFTASLSDLSPLSLARPISLSERIYMSVYSSSSVDTEHSEYSNPPARKYRVPNFQNMSRKITSVCFTSEH
jgi:hypothetical protein